MKHFCVYKQIKKRIQTSTEKTGERERNIDSTNTHIEWLCIGTQHSKKEKLRKRWMLCYSVQDAA